MKSPVIAAILLVLAAPATASPRVTATAAQWRDIHTLYDVFGSCGPEREADCDISARLQDKLGKQGFCFHKRLIVGKLAWRGPEKDRVQLWPKGEKQCYALHDPDPDYAP